MSEDLEQAFERAEALSRADDLPTYAGLAFEGLIADPTDEIRESDVSDRPEDLDEADWDEHYEDHR